MNKLLTYGRKLQGLQKIDLQRYFCCSIYVYFSAIFEASQLILDIAAYCSRSNRNHFFSNQVVWLQQFFYLTSQISLFRLLNIGIRKKIFPNEKYLGKSTFLLLRIDLSKLLSILNIMGLQFWRADGHEAELYILHRY